MSRQYDPVAAMNAIAQIEKNIEARRIARLAVPAEEWECLRSLIIGLDRALRDARRFERQTRSVKPTLGLEGQLKAVQTSLRELSLAVRELKAAYDFKNPYGRSRKG